MSTILNLEVEMYKNKVEKVLKDSKCLSEIKKFKRLKVYKITVMI